MEQFDGTSEGEWSNTLNGMYAVEKTDFMVQISSNSYVANGSAGILAFGVSSALWPSNDPTIPNATGIDQYPCYSTDIASTHNLFSFSLGSSSTGSHEDCAWSDKNMVLHGNCSTIPVGFSLEDAKASSYLVDVEESESDQEKPILPSEILQQATADCAGSRPSGKNESNKGNSPKRPRPLIEVDISIMLEEAVQYVKFLQFQIKLLSSDDLWMYAPIVYSGMNIGLDLKKITTLRQP